jgi:hypothetical protein
MTSQANYACSDYSSDEEEEREGNDSMKEDTAQTCRARVCNAARRALQKGMGALAMFWRGIAPMMLYCACSSQSTFQTLRLALSYCAPQPFNVIIVNRHDMELSEQDIDASHCVRLYLKAGADHASYLNVPASILKCGKRQLTEKKKDKPNQ